MDSRLFDPDAIEWEELDSGVDTATLDVPVDYADPDGPVFELFLARHRASNPDERIGSLLVNPGGPGFGGSNFAIGAEVVPFDEELLDHFDIIGWDPRGTGRERAVHRLHRRLRPVLRRARHHTRHGAGAPADRRPRRGVRRRLRREQRRHHRARRHEQLGARHRHHPPCPRRGDDLVLRVQLRERARRRRGRRCSPTPCGRRCSTERAIRTPIAPRRPSSSCEASNTRSRRSSPSAAPIPTARSTTTATPRVRSTS